VSKYDLYFFGGAEGCDDGCAIIWSLFIMWSADAEGFGDAIICPDMWFDDIWSEDICPDIACADEVGFGDAVMCPDMWLDDIWSEDMCPDIAFADDVGFGEGVAIPSASVGTVVSKTSAIAVGANDFMWIPFEMGVVICMARKKERRPDGRG